MVVSSRVMTRVGTVLLLSVVALTLFLAESSYWINHTVFEKQSFTQVTTTELQRESSRQAMATAIVDATLEDRPVAQRVLGQRLIAFTTGLLASDVSTQVIESVTDKTYSYVTAPNREDITIDLTTIKTSLSALIALAETQGGGDKLGDIQAQVPSEIVLVESATFPDLSGLVKTMLWLGPLLWLLFLGSALMYLYLGRHNYARSVYMLGAVIGLVALLGLFVMPFIPNALAAVLPNISLRPVAVNLSNGFLAPFREQMQLLLAMTAVALIIFNQRFNILRATQTLITKIAGGTKKYANKQ